MHPIIRTIKTVSSPNILYVRYCHSVFDLHKLIKRSTPYQFKVRPIGKALHPTIINIIKEHYFKEHVFVKYRCIDICEDHAIDEYLKDLLKQGNSLYATTEDGKIAGVCVNFENTPIAVKNLRKFAFYRQDVNIKDLLIFLSKMDETPNLWKTLEQNKIFELKMLTVLPEYRRQGLSVLLTEKSKDLARDEGHKCIRMNCINANDYKIAERCMFDCIAKYPLHKIVHLKGPYIRQESCYNRYLRVYVKFLKIKDDQSEQIKKQMKMCQMNLDECLQ